MKENAVLVGFRRLRSGAGYQFGPGHRTQNRLPLTGLEPSRTRSANLLQQEPRFRRMWTLCCVSRRRYFEVERRFRISHRAKALERDIAGETEADLREVGNILELVAFPLPDLEQGLLGQVFGF